MSVIPLNQEFILKISLGYAARLIFILIHPVKYGSAAARPVESLRVAKQIPQGKPFHGV